jgi:gas vesicle protein
VNTTTCKNRHCSWQPLSISGIFFDGSAKSKGQTLLTKNCTQEDGMKSFLFGLGLGIGLGLLFAPMSGEETRNNLAERADDLASSARERYQRSRDKMQRGVQSIRSTAERAMGQVRSAANNETLRSTGTENRTPANI